MDKSVQKISNICFLAALIALNLIISRFRIGTGTVKIDFAFIIIFLTGYFFDYIYTGLASGVCDVIGSIIGGTGYFPGFTISAILTGIITSIFFYNHKITWKRVILYQLLITIFINLLLNTIWIIILLHASLISMFIPRLITNLISLPIQIISIYYIGNNQSIKIIKDRFIK